MGTEARRKAEIRIGWGFFLFLVGSILIIVVPSLAHSTHMSPGMLSFLCFLDIALPLVGIFYWVTGFASYASTKGYSPIIAILGALGLLGLLILVVLPDQKTETPETRQPMAAERRRAENRIGWGFFLSLLGFYLFLAVPSPMGASWPSVVQGLAVLVMFASLAAGPVQWFSGFAKYAKTKNYSPVIALLGVFSLLGLLVMVALPEQKTETPESRQLMGL